MQKTVTQTSGIESVSERIYVSLKNSIISGQISEDEIHTEISVAGQFSASRTPAREALRRLEAEGFLQTVPRKGYRVYGLQDRDILDIYDLAIALEPMSAYLAAKHRTQSQLDRLREITASEERQRERFRDHPDAKALREYSSRNREFHVLIAQASENQYLSTYVETIQDKLLMHEAYYANFRNYVKNEKQWSFTSHASICSAIEIQDAETAEFLMRKHFVKSKEIWIQALSPKG